MKRIVFLMLTILNLTANGQKPVITVSPSKPEAGQKVTITYTGKLAKEGTKMSHIFCYDGDFSMPTKVIPTRMINNALVGSFTLPDSVSFFSIKITNKKEQDNNDGQGHGFHAYQGGQLKKGTFFSEGYAMFYNEWFFGGKVDGERAIQLMQKDFTLHPELEKKNRYYYVWALSEVADRKAEGVRLARKYFDEIIATGENEMYSGRYAYLIANEKQKTYDSLRTVAVKRFPSGAVAFSIKLEALKNQTYAQPDSALALFEQIRNDFPSLRKSQERFLMLYVMMAYIYKFDFEGFDKSYALLEQRDGLDGNKALVAETLNEIAWGMGETGKNLPQAKVISGKAVDLYYQYDSLSTYYGNALDTYALILSKSGDTQGALSNQRKAVKLYDGLHLNMNQQLIKYLSDNKDFAEARTKAEAFIIENGPNARIDSIYKAAYIGAHGNESGFSDAYAGLQNRSDLKYADELKTKLIDVDAPDFELKDMDGKRVKLSDFRGSVVVLDFWATWCGPCIKSFPAMKKAMNELKDQPVRFLFIDTMESDDTEKKTEKIKKTLESKKVNEFRVLLDEKEGDSYLVKTAYALQSIPAKYIIDRKGKIRYKNEGFYTDEDLIREIKMVVQFIGK